MYADATAWDAVRAVLTSWTFWGLMYGISLMIIFAAAFSSPTYNDKCRLIEATCYHWWRKRSWWTPRKLPAPHPQYVCQSCRKFYDTFQN